MAAAASIRVAFNATINRNLSTYLAPSWIPIKVVGSVRLDIGFKEVDASIRGTGGSVMTEPTLIEIAIDFDVKTVPSDANYVWLRTTILTRGVLDLLLSTTDPVTSGEFTLRADFKGFKFGQDEPLGGILANGVTIKPCYSLNPVIFAQIP